MHSKGNHKQNEKTRRKYLKICDLQGINFQNIQTVYIGQKKKKNTKSKNGQISTVLQRRHTDSQKAHEKMLDTANY